MIPFKMLEVVVSTGRIVSEGRKVSGEADTVHEPSAKDRATFSPSSFDRTRLQQLLDQLYAERTDTVSVMHTYRLFRANRHDVNTRNGVEFVGYQMVKMENFQEPWSYSRQMRATTPRRQALGLVSAGPCKPPRG
ncbi:MAG: hypothetical protein M3Z85_16995 [Acidobacteriota bacterium]|nr:hypothetical protein [Acidobacteriota bacterium]